MIRSLRLLFVVISGLAVAGVTACHKETASPTAATLSQLEGRWEFAHSYSGFSGPRSADPARRRELVFGANGQVQLRLNDTVTATTSYTLTQQVAYTTQKAETFVVFGTPTNTPGQYIAGLSATTLVLREDHPADGLSTTYQRVPLPQ